MKACSPALRACFAFTLLFHLKAAAQPFIAEGRKALAVVPTQTLKVRSAVVTLNGAWEINTSPGENVWKTNSGPWQRITVPGEPMMQGFTIKTDKEFFYRTTISIPGEAGKKSILIRFNGVYSYARVFVNGKFVREHFGGFTAWDVDITPFVKAGKKAVVHVGITDRSDDISYASGYAHHTIGGILRSVQLLVLPRDYINRFYVQTDLSKDLKRTRFVLNVAKTNETTGGKIRFQLYDPNGKAILPAAHEFPLNGKGQVYYSFNILNPVLWNEEQPRLYTLKAEFIQNGRTQERFEQKIGIRKIEVDGKRLLVNGMPVKLRGACRHDMHPLMGRSTNRYYDSLDVVLAKEANINFIRTSHYPPSEDFLEFADRYGLLVQEETAVCFASKGRVGIYKQYGETGNDTSFTSRYLGQLCEMIDRDRNHPSVIMWSIGNESTYGSNFQKEYEFIKTVDVSRPVSWSFPGTATRENKRCFDIAVAHYPKYDGTDTSNAGLYYRNMEHASLPLLSDEWAHVPCYNTTLLKTDPNINDFWGRSLDTMWMNRFDIAGNLGGAIWAMTDETFYLPDSVTGYGPWGIVDVWRRKKPEFWNAKKAYSPVRVLQTEFNTGGKEQMIRVPVKNRFNHLSLNQIILKISAGNNSYYSALPDLKPHEEGHLPVTVRAGDKFIMLQFFDARKMLIDEERITLFKEKMVKPATEDRFQWTVSRHKDIITLKRQDLFFQINALTGQLLKAGFRGKDMLTGSPKPFINKPLDANTNYETTAIHCGDYREHAITIDTSSKDKFVVQAQGRAGAYPVTMTSSYFADGTIQIDYRADSIPEFTWQIGIAFPVSNSFSSIRWKRRGYWSTYPQADISATEGSAFRYTNCREPYRTKPSCTISEDMDDYFLSRSTHPERADMKASPAYRGTKENILSMNLIAGPAEITLVSDGRQAAKMQMLPGNAQELLVMNKWDYWGLGWGNFAGTKNLSPVIRGTIVLQLTKSP